MQLIIYMRKKTPPDLLIHTQSGPRMAQIDTHIYDRILIETDGTRLS